MNNREEQRSVRELAIILSAAVVILLLSGMAQAFGSAGGTAAADPIRIRRVMTGNPSACYPVAGQYYDWIELENAGDADVSLRGWKLADGKDLRGAYVFAGGVIPAGGTQIVYCAPRPEDAPEEAVFTGFRLSSEGELLLLADPRERVAEALDVPAMKPGMVYLRDEKDAWRVEQLYSAEDAPPVEEASYAAGGLYINEMMPANHSALLDMDGDCPDWIELYNGGDRRIDLEGFGLSVRSGKGAEWRFPARALEPGEYLLVFASGKDRCDGSELHAGFKLPSDSCMVRLFDREDREISRLSCGSAGRDESISRTDGGGVTHSWPATPGYRNSETGVPDDLPLLAENELGLYINEFSNAPGAGEWVELRNASAAGIDLAGMGLSDNLARPRKWQFPQGARIEAGGYLVVTLGDEGAGGSYAAGFSASAGETLCLSTADGRVVDHIQVPALSGAISVGRADGEARYRCFAQPTPGSENAGQSYARQTGRVSFSVPGGAHAETSLTVALESDAGAAIRYTTDGSEPTEASPLYAGPLTLTGSAAIRAVASRPGELPSESAMSTYILGEAHPNLYVTCVSGSSEALIGDRGALNTGANDSESDVYVEIYNASGERLLGQACSFMVSGHNTRVHYAQKAFRLKARASYGDNRFRAKLFTRRNYDAFKSITLRASGQDCFRTHMQDSVLTALADATRVMYLETEVTAVYVNGRYWGAYNLRERVTPQLIAEYEGWDDPDEIVLIRNGKAEQGSASSYKRLMDWVAGADLSDENNLAQLRRFVDVECYLDYVALQIYASNLDLSNVRCYCNPAKGGRWRWIIFDLDLSFQVDRNMPRDWLTPGGVGTITQQDNTLFIKLMENEEVRRYFLQRCGELLSTSFSAESVVARIRERYDLLKDEMSLNCARWDWSTSTWDKYVKKMARFAQERPSKLVGYFASAFQLSEGEVQTYFGGVQ